MSTPQIAIKNLHIHLPPLIAPSPDIERVAKELLSRQATNKAETSLDRFVLIADGQIVVDNSTGLWWPVNESGSALNYDDAVTYCRDCRVGGYDDWRMPTRFELEGILDLDRHAPALPPVFKSHGEYVWTGTQTAWTRDGKASARSFFVVYMGGGHVDSGYANHRFRARPVRVGGPAPASEESQ